LAAALSPPLQAAERLTGASSGTARELNMPTDLAPIHVADAAAGTPRHRRSDSLRVATPTGDPYRRLRGEPPIDKATDADARRWVEVYTDMVRVWDQTATQFEGWVAEVTSSRARQELGDVDHTLVAARCERLRRRLHLWEQRARELEMSADGPANPGSARRA
jgi:hypothetical protein